MSPKCSPHIAPSGVPCIRPPMPQGSKSPNLPVMMVNGTAPDKSGNVIVGIPDLEDLKGKVVQLENDDQAYSLLKLIAEALGMQVGAGGSWTGTVYVSLGAFATKDTIGPDDLTPELKAQLKGDKGDVGQIGPQGPVGPQGPQGPQGAQGAQGERGERGETGSQGLQGPQGAPLVVTRTQETSDPGGYNVVMLSDGTTLTIRNGTVGPTGQKGDRGERGEKGDTGAKGEKGDKGDKGDRGADGTVAFDYLTEEQKASLKGDPGEKGDKGDKGDPGEKGEKGEKGESVSLEVLEVKRDKTDLAVYEVYHTVRVADECFPIVFYSETITSESVRLDQFEPGGDYHLDIGGRAGYCSFSADGFFAYGDLSVTYGGRKPVVGEWPRLDFVATITPTSDKILTSKNIVPLSDALEDKRDKTDLTVYVGDKNKPMLPPDALPVTWYDETGYKIEISSHSDGEYLLRTGVSGIYIADFYSDGTLRSADPTTRFGGKPGIDGQWPKLIFGGAVPTSDKVLTSADVVSLLPRYLFANAAVADGVVTIAPYTNAKLISDGTAFTVVVGGETGSVMRDCQFTLDCTGLTDPPKIIWGEHFHPRTDAADLACVAGVRNVYKLSEYAPGEFMVSRWQETTGGNPLVRYYPEGNVNSEAELTRGIKYDAPDATARTITVKSFVVTDDPENDNSSLVGRVVIPPFVDSDGNPYISDDGTRYKVVGVSGGSVTSDNRELTTIIAPSTVTTIMAQAFTSCVNLTSVSLPAATTIGMNAFSSCSALVSVSLPAVTIVEDNAFSFCYAMVSVSLPAATSLGYSAFGYCEALASVDFGDTPRSYVPSIGLDTFDAVPTSCKIIVPDAQYDEWVAAHNWSELVTWGYPFLRHSEWEGAPK